MDFHFICFSFFPTGHVRAKVRESTHQWDVQSQVCFEGRESSHQWDVQSQVCTQVFLNQKTPISHPGLFKSKDFHFISTLCFPFFPTGHVRAKKRESTHQWDVQARWHYVKSHRTDDAHRLCIPMSMKAPLPKTKGTMWKVTGQMMHIGCASPCPFKPLSQKRKALCEKSQDRWCTWGGPQASGQCL